jgi:hypothetical protein
LYIDRRYIMYAAGLLAERHPAVAYKVLADNLVEV